MHTICGSRVGLLAFVEAAIVCRGCVTSVQTKGVRPIGQLQVFTFLNLNLSTRHIFQGGLSTSHENGVSLQSTADNVYLISEYNAVQRSK